MRDPLGKAGAGIVHRAPPDPRIGAMARLCDAIDAGRPRDVVAIIREFRAMGLSTCLIKPQGQGAGQ